MTTRHEVVNELEFVYRDKKRALLSIIKELRFARAHNPDREKHYSQHANRERKVRLARAEVRGALRAWLSVKRPARLNHKAILVPAKDCARGGGTCDCAYGCRYE